MGYPLSFRPNRSITIYDHTGAVKLNNIPAQVLNPYVSIDDMATVDARICGLGSLALRCVIKSSTCPIPFYSANPFSTSTVDYAELDPGTAQETRYAIVDCLYWPNDSGNPDAYSEMVLMRQRNGDPIPPPNLNDIPPGSILLFAGALLPPMFLWCDGSAYGTDVYPRLFAAIGTTWGSAPGQYFVPDLRGRSPVGAGSGTGLSPRSLGQALGEETHLMTVAEMASHKHTFGGGTFTGAVWINRNSGVDVGPGAAFADTATMDNTGGNTPHNNMQPSAVCNFIIYHG